MDQRARVSADRALLFFRQILNVERFSVFNDNMCFFQLWEMILKNYSRLGLFEDCLAAVRSRGLFRQPPPLGHPLPEGERDDSDGCVRFRGDEAVDV